MNQTALANGWESAVVPVVSKFLETNDPDDIVWNVYAKRGHESLHVVFTGDRQTRSTYVYGDYRLHPARRAGVMNLLTGNPDVRKFRRVETDPAKLLESRSVPWQDDSPALDILLAVMDKTVKWVRRMDNDIRTAWVPKDTNQRSKHFRVYSNVKGERFLEWTNVEGFHTVRLDSIIEVG